MSIKLKIEVDSTWVFSHGDDEVLPVDYLKKTLENTFGEKLTVDDATFTELYVTINSDEINVESTVQSIKDDFVKNYGLLNDRMISVEAELCESKDKDVKKELDDLHSPYNGNYYITVSTLIFLFPFVLCLFSVEQFNDLFCFLNNI